MLSQTSKIIIAIAITAIVAGGAIFLWQGRIQQSRQPENFQIEQIEQSKQLLETTPSSAAKQQQYDFFCYPKGQAPQQVKIILNPLLDRAGWRNADGGARVCLDTSGSFRRALVLTNDCHPTDDVANPAEPCRTTAIVLIDLVTGSIRSLVSQTITDEFYGTRPFTEILSWASDSVAYRALPIRGAGEYGDIECVPQDIKKYYAYQDRVLTIADGQSRVLQTCYNVSCSDLSELECVPQ
ncbi:MAG: hypothetical protein UX17_C0014G0008 [Parcubacteria group bacterium GW2011_GWC2_45_7]|nr:MAG: hypothetical protein UX17_C0014G0008 [Parcubacteria group bacterium GW2011_GWC2_45_7]KKU74034.1 MAG: hypothetical protein UX98_C0002G0064 [Parcubacteria group bacterium GW2011_GWA2_47_26]